jgi:hypothetical protein
MSKKPTHVVSDPNGGWSVKKGGAIRASKRFDTQKDAITYARNLGKNDGVDVVIHKRDGTIRNKETYGNDPSPPRDAQG